MGFVNEFIVMNSLSSFGEMIALEILEEILLVQMLARYLQVEADTICYLRHFACYCADLFYRPHFKRSFSMSLYPYYS